MAAHDPANLSTAGNWISTIIAGIGVAVAAAIGYLREKKEPKAASEVVIAAATLSDRATVEHLTKTIDALRETVERLNGLLEAEAQLRHDNRVRAEAIHEERSRAKAARERGNR